LIYITEPGIAGVLTNSKEVWFVGCHSGMSYDTWSSSVVTEVHGWADVGGGKSQNTQEHSLSNISLRWMVNEIVDTNCPIQFNASKFGQWHIRVPQDDHLSRAKESLPMANDNVERDRQDVIEKITDPLRRNPLWWVLELIPTWYSYWDARISSWW
jgi:hypothetical protein